MLVVPFLADCLGCPLCCNFVWVGHFSREVTGECFGLPAEDQTAEG